MKLISLSVTVCLAILLSACATRPPLITVSQVNLKRYSGKWYEIARTPNWFERKCVANVSAEYIPLPDGSIKVVNTCLCKNSKSCRAIGRAAIVPGSKNAKLKVTFFSPFWGHYWIIGLDEKNYQWALVGEPSRKYLWILARQPTISSALYEGIATIAAAKGYDTSQLKKTPQTRLR